MKNVNKTLLTAFVHLSFAPLAMASPLLLLDGDDGVKIDPLTLAIEWQLKEQNYLVNQGKLRVNELEPSKVEITSKNQNSASWQYLPSQIEVNARLEQGELQLDFSVTDTTLKKARTINWFHLPEDQTQALLLPFNEGLYIPTDNESWADYLQRYSGSDTTQSLKMPFWSKQVLPTDTPYEPGSLNNIHKDALFASVLLVNPFNNRLDFNARDQAGTSSPLVEMQASHTFKPLSQDETFSVIFSLDDDPLSGAKQYRQWRIDNGEAETLAQKMEQQPDIERLIGAGHVYLFGAGLLAFEDVRDWWGLHDWFFNRSELAQYADAKVTTELKSFNRDESWFNHHQKNLLVQAINNALNQHIPVVATPDDSDYISRQYQMAQRQKEYLKARATNYLLPAGSWGQGLSTDMLSAMDDAGLEKLWLGVSKWMSAFYQPDVVTRAKEQGYLVATYDSYNTGIPQGLNDTWITAHLPDEVRNNCAIVQADGTRQKGFRGNGYYQNPACGREYAQQRMADVIHYGRFNSYFLDVDATGMVRDDFNPALAESDHESVIGTPQSVMAEAYNDRMNWLHNNEQVVVGSEDGNGVTTRGIAYAHGMETVGFGWRDPDMTRNRQSPYFLGAWYPDHKPAYFFKSAEVKEPYKALFFSPEFKVPLYQTVFNDEVINSHHWHSDSLKFSDVQNVRDIISMLYVTPPMVHLSRDEATSADSPRIKALQHYQTLYQPLHEALWDQQLVGFKWLSEDGLVQKTTFSDGSVILGNLSPDTRTVQWRGKALSLEPYSVRAVLKAENDQPEVLTWQPVPFSDFAVHESSEGLG